MSARRTGLWMVLAATLAALALSAAPGAGIAGAATPRADFADIEDEVMCDTCNVALNVAESPRADQLREEIRDLIADGLTKPQVKTRLKAQYGPNILAEPDKDGLGIVPYVLPIALAVALPALLAVLLPRWRRRAAQTAGVPAGAPGDASDADERRLDDELARYGA